MWVLAHLSFIKPHFVRGCRAPCFLCCLIALPCCWLLKPLRWLSFFLPIKNSSFHFSYFASSWGSFWKLGTFVWKHTEVLLVSSELLFSSAGPAGLLLSHHPHTYQRSFCRVYSRLLLILKIKIELCALRESPHSLFARTFIPPPCTPAGLLCSRGENHKPLFQAANFFNISPSTNMQ